MKKALKLLMFIFIFAISLEGKNMHLEEEFMNLSTDEMKTKLHNVHPAGYFILAARVYEEKKFDEAVQWLYIAQIRYRAYLLAFPNLEPSADPALFSSLLESIGRPINQYAGEDIKNWITQIENAKKWHEENAYESLAKKEYEEHYKQTLDGLDEMIKELETHIK